MLGGMNARGAKGSDEPLRGWLACVLACALVGALACGQAGSPAVERSGAGLSATRGPVLVLAFFDGLTRERLELAPTAVGWSWQNRLPISTSRSALLAGWLTGLDSAVHGLASARDAGAERLDPGVPLLAEAFAQRSGRAFAAVAAPTLGDEYCGLARGFEAWDAPPAPAIRGAQATVDALLERSAAARAGSATLLLLVAFQAQPDVEPAELAPHLARRLESGDANADMRARLANPATGAAAAADFARDYGRRRGSAQSAALAAAWGDAAFARQWAALERLLAALPARDVAVAATGYAAGGWPTFAGEPFDIERWRTPVGWRGPALAEDSALGSLAPIGERARSTLAPEFTRGALPGQWWGVDGERVFVRRLLHGRMEWRIEELAPGGEEVVPRAGTVPPVWGGGEWLEFTSAPSAPAVQWSLVSADGDLLGRPPGGPRNVRVAPGERLRVELLRRGANVVLTRPEDCTAVPYGGGMAEPLSDDRTVSLGPDAPHFDALFAARALEPDNSAPPPGALRVVRTGPRPGRLEDGPLGAVGPAAVEAARALLFALPSGQ